jgi:hypothetical protein
LTKNNSARLKRTTAKSTRRKNVENALKTEELKRSKADQNSVKNLKKKSLEMIKKNPRKKRLSTNPWSRRPMKSRRAYS